MSGSKVSISTRQASTLLGVHESSVKRWCNAENLECWLTPGGHRRIPIDALVDFAHAQGIQLPLRYFGEDAGRVWSGLERAHQNEYEELAALIAEWLDHGWTSDLARLIEYLEHEGFGLAQVLDRLIGPVMRRIGDRYHRGALSIGDEHRMTQIMRDALLSLHSSPTQASNGRVKPVAVVGCARGEGHELGALMVRLVLEAEDWRVIYLGLDVPTEEFAAQQIKHGAALVCVSMMPPKGLAEAQTIMHLLNRMYNPTHPFRLALGGSALNNDANLDRSGVSIPDVQLFTKMEPFTTWVGSLAA